MKTKVTFKKQAQETGLAVVGRPYQDVDCKIKGKMFGCIAAPNWQTKDNKWRVRIMIIKPEPDDNPNCNWRWLTFAAEFDGPEPARTWLQYHIEKIMKTHTLRFAED